MFVEVRTYYLCIRRQVRTYYPIMSVEVSIYYLCMSNTSKFINVMW